MKVALHVLVLLALTLSARPVRAQAEPPAPSPTTVVARVNGEDITRGQLDQAMQEVVRSMMQQGQSIPPEQRAHIEKNVLNQLIGERLMIEKSKSLKIEDLDGKVQKRLDMVKKQFGDEKAFLEGIKSMGLDEAKLKARIIEGIRMEALIDQDVRSKIKVTDADIKDFYDKNPQYFNQPAQIRASHILVLVKEDADEKTKAEKKATIDKARARVAGGEDFAKVATEVSEDPGSKTRGGDLGFFGPGQMVKPFEDAAFALKSNEVSQVVTSQFGYHIIKQTGNKPAGTVPLEQEKPKIERFLMQQKTQQAMLEYIESLKKDAKVEVLLK